VGVGVCAGDATAVYEQSCNNNEYETSENIVWDSAELFCRITLSTDDRDVTSTSADLAGDNYAALPNVVTQVSVMCGLLVYHWVYTHA
jgi:spermidine/putrescine-binding protein